MNPVDPMLEAVERARALRDGDIGQTPEPGVSRSPAQTPAAARPAARPGPTAAPVAPATASAAAAAPRMAAAGAASPTTPASVAGGQGPAGHGPRVVPVARRSAVPPIVYDQTRVVDLNRRILMENRVIAADVDDPRVESYRQLRSQVLGTLRRNGMRTLAITSPKENAGKTLTAINLAICIAQDVNQTVLLVDLDLHCPSVHQTLGVEIDRGVVDHLSEGEPLENILLNIRMPRMVVLPGLPQRQRSSELLTSPAMHDFLEEVTARYPDRLIIFDLPPLLRNDDAMSFVPQVDTTLLVVEDEVTTRADLQRSLQLLQHTTLIGTVLNKAR